MSTFSEQTGLSDCEKLPDSMSVHILKVCKCHSELPYSNKLVQFEMKLFFLFTEKNKVIARYLLGGKSSESDHQLGKVEHDADKGESCEREKEEHNDGIAEDPAPHRGSPSPVQSDPLCRRLFEALLVVGEHLAVLRPLAGLVERGSQSTGIN